MMATVPTVRDHRLLCAACAFVVLAVPAAASRSFASTYGGGGGSSTVKLYDGADTYTGGGTLGSESAAAVTATA